MGSQLRLTQMLLVPYSSCSATGSGNVNICILLWHGHSCAGLCIFRMEILPFLLFHWYSLLESPNPM